MGVKSLNTFVKKYGRVVDTSEYKDKTVAVDTSIFLYKHKYKASQKQFLKRFDYQINNFLKHGIRIIYIFDGPAPIEKLETKEKRKEKSSSSNTEPIVITREDIQALKDHLSDRNIEFFVSPGEGEKGASYLNFTGVADLVVSNDLDSLLFGCTKLLTTSKDSFVEYDAKKIFEELDITLDNLIELGIVSGCDYKPEGVPGFGPSKALKHIKSGKKLSDLCTDFDLQRYKNLFTDFTQETEFYSNNLL